MQLNYTRKILENIWLFAFYKSNMFLWRRFLAMKITEMKIFVEIREFVNYSSKEKCDNHVKLTKQYLYRYRNTYI